MAGEQRPGAGPTMWPRVPCGNLVEAPQAHCYVGRRFPDDCPGCSAYSEGLTEQERVRCEVWTRVMGYHRPVSAFNPGKRSEHRERLYFREPAVDQAGGCDGMGGAQRLRTALGGADGTAP